MACLLAVGACGNSGSSPVQPSARKAPWPDPDRVRDRVSAAGLNGGEQEVLTVHYHAHLDIFVNGGHEAVAASIGREGQRFFSPLHTHATSGMLHIEAPKDQHFTLGMLFTEWGVRLTDRCVAVYCEPATRLAAYVNGEAHSGPIGAIVFRKGDEIALVIGTPPSSVPSGWDCKARIDVRLEDPAQCADFA